LQIGGMPEWKDDGPPGPPDTNPLPQNQPDPRPGTGPGDLGANTFLRHQLTAPKAQFARIYAFSYEGTFYNLPKPAVFLVHGPGSQIRGAGLPNRGNNDDQPVASDSGLPARDFEFEWDMLKWEYDKGDFSLRCDIVSGTFEEILLDAALSMTARDALTSRSDLTARSDLTSRSDVTSRSDLTARHRLKG
jgi:hypothetical protein